MSEYWRECIKSAAEECGLILTLEQLIAMTDAVRCAHENHGLYSGETPPMDYNWKERTVQELKKEHKKETDGLKEERRLFEIDAEKAVKRVGEMRIDADIRIVEGGYIERRR